MEPSVTLYNADCLEIMKSMPDKSVDAVITDPPYGTTACAWDAVIPLPEMWAALHGIVSEHAAIVLTASQPFTANLVMSNPSEFREEVVWLKNRAASGFMAGRRHLKVHETILVFAADAEYTFNPQHWLVETKEFLTQRKTFKNRRVGNNVYSEMTAPFGRERGERNPVSIVSARLPITPANSKIYGQEVDLRFHPTQKPYKLMRYLVDTYSSRGDVVLDFAMGSGTTGVACVQTGRNFIGCEIDPGYFEIAKRRIEEAQMQIRMPI